MWNMDYIHNLPTVLKVQIIINKKRSDTTGREYVTFDYVGDEPESADSFVNADEADLPFGNN